MRLEERLAEIHSPDSQSSGAARKSARRKSPPDNTANSTTTKLLDYFRGSHAPDSRKPSKNSRRSPSVSRRVTPPGIRTTRALAAREKESTSGLVLLNSGPQGTYSKDAAFGAQIPYENKLPTPPKFIVGEDGRDSWSNNQKVRGDSSSGQAPKQESGRGGSDEDCVGEDSTSSYLSSPELVRRKSPTGDEETVAVPLSRIHRGVHAFSPPPGYPPRKTYPPPQDDSVNSRIPPSDLGRRAVRGPTSVVGKDYSPITVGPRISQDNRDSQPTNRDFVAIKHQYDVLSDERLEIRLLSIKAFNEESRAQKLPVSCKLKTVSLLEKPDYDALSYCWGTAEDAKELIHIDGFQQMVTQTLAEALRQLRVEHSKHELLLWVDFVCINQANKVEKARQILLMNRIFARASTVYAWLGIASPQAPLAINILTELASGKSIGDNLSPGILKLVEQAFLEVSTNPLWRRVWIIQELATAGKLYLHWGPHKIPWETFSAASKTEGFRHIFQGVHAKALDAVQSFRTQEQQILRTSRRASLFKALLDTRVALASEPRDKIYALINLTSDGRDIIPFPNYTQSEEDILLEAATGIIVQQQKVGAMLLARRRRTKSDRLTLPSWVPDWFALDVDIPGWILDSVRRTTDTQPFEISTSAGTLTVPGKLITEIDNRNRLWFLPDQMMLVIGLISRYPIQTSLQSFCELLKRLEDEDMKNLRESWEGEADHVEFEKMEELWKLYQYVWKALYYACQSFRKTLPSEPGDFFNDMVQRLSKGDIQVVRSRNDYLIWIVDGEAQLEDRIFLLPNCALPVVLRRCGDHYVFIGETLPSYSWYDDGMPAEPPFDEGLSDDAGPYPVTIRIK